jgi:hypothetical protein
MGIAIVHYYSPHTLKSKRIKRIEMIQFTGFPNGTDDAKSFRAADGSKTACDFELDFHGTHLAFGGIVNDFGFRNAICCRRSLTTLVLLGLGGLRFSWG